MRSGRSSARSRSGGTETERTLKRKRRSSRNVPARTSGPIGRRAVVRRRALSLTGAPPPRGRPSPPSSTRRSFACTSGVRSSTRSRSKVPSPAAARSPSRESVAPVNAPGACPKSSSSKRDAFRLAALTATNGSAARDERAWTARATSSLPEPLGPSMWSGTELAAALTISPRRRSMASLRPTMPSLPGREPPPARPPALPGRPAASPQAPAPGARVSRRALSAPSSARSASSVARSSSSAPSSACSRARRAPSRSPRSLRARALLRARWAGFVLTAPRAECRPRRSRRARCHRGGHVPPRPPPRQRARFASSSAARARAE